MSKAHYEATAPDGTIMTRSTGTRQYTHCIIGRRCEATERRNAADPHHAKADARSFDYWTRILTTGDERMRADAAERLAGATDAQSYIAAQLAARIGRCDQAAANGVYLRWNDLGWVGRPDLVPGAIKHAGRRDWQTDVRAIPAVLVEKPRKKSAGA